MESTLGNAHTADPRKRPRYADRVQLQVAVSAYEHANTRHVLIKIGELAIFDAIQDPDRAWLVEAASVLTKLGITEGYLHKALAAL